MSVEILSTAAQLYVKFIWRDLQLENDVEGHSRSPELRYSICHVPLPINDDDDDDDGLK